MKMKRVCLLISLALPLVANSADTGRGVAVEPVAAVAPGGNAGLFVGVNQFTEDKSLRSLDFAVNDAIAQAHLFVVELKLIPPANTYLALSGEPTTATAKTELVALEKTGVRRVSAVKSSLLRTVQTMTGISGAPADMLVVSLSSHGFEERGVAYVMPADGIRGFLEDSAVNLNSVEQRLAQSKAGKRLLLVDACREKPGTEGRGADAPMTSAFRSALAAAEGQAVLASCDAGQISLENLELGHGVFTHFLLKALRGEASADGRGFITLGAVSDYVAQSVHGWVARNRPSLDRRAVQQPWFKGPKIAEQIPLAVDPGIRARLGAFKSDVVQTVDGLRTKINRKGEFNLQVYDRLAEALEKAEDDEAGRKLLKHSKDFLNGKIGEDLFVGFLERTLETPEQRKARLEREAAERQARERAAKIASLLATVQANDNKENGKTALAALDELLKLDPAHRVALALRAKISAYYGPSKDAPWTNSLGMKFVPVKDTDALFCVWETRMQDYQAFVTATGQSWEKSSFEQGPTHPAVNVSWEEAKAFCAWLTKKEQGEGRLQAGQSYRLPTDAEWSAAVGLGREGGGTPQDKDGKIKDVYPWGRQWSPPRGAGNYGSSLNVDEYANTSPVGSFAANESGLFDMGGNVWEWCEDLYSSSSSSRVLRGASWYYVGGPVGLLSSCRYYSGPGFRYGFYGFRCVLVAGAFLSR